MRRCLTIILAAAAIVLVAASAAQAVVVSIGGGRAGVALLPGTRATLAKASVSTVTSSAPCSDPWLSSDFILPDSGLCWHGGSVIHSNETFAFTWDPLRRYWATTRNYVEQFLGDVANGSGTLTSPYALTGQYNDPHGRATNQSLYGGACIDYGAVGGSACQFGISSGTAAGHDYPSNACPVSGTNAFSQGTGGTAPNDVCVTESEIQTELSAMISETGVPGRTKAGYTPLLTLLTPPGVVTCLDGAGTVCSANSAAKVRFCSYHSQVSVGGTEFAYVVVPWVALTGCDEPDAPQISDNPDAQTLATDIGIRLVSPLSQGQLAAIVNPGLDGWYALDGSEINDNGCAPLAHQLDAVTVGNNSYLLQREFSNAGVIESDPNAQACAPSVQLSPRFVVPSAVNKGDVVEFDGSTTISSLLVPRTNYVWHFGDGTMAFGPSVVHTYNATGTYQVTLGVLDRGGNYATLSQTIVVGTPGGPSAQTALKARLQLLPQDFGSVLRKGLAVQVSSNQAADGIAALIIPGWAARRAHLASGRAASAVIGRGTVSGIKAGTVRLRLQLKRSVASRLRPLGHVTLTVRLMLVAAGGQRISIDAAGRY